MREDLLHFVWKYKSLSNTDLRTTGNDLVRILDIGTHNSLAGPDFFNAKIRIGEQLWAGNVEIHVNSSDWYRHNHEKDINYNNVILHVVWEEDVRVFRNNNEPLPTLELKNHIPPRLLQSYQQLFDTTKKEFIFCERELSGIDSFIWSNWMERLYFERLEGKTELVFQWLKASKNDWEKVAVTLLFKNFGSTINGDSFLAIAQSLDISLIRKLQNNALQLESLFFGMAGFLEDDSIHDTYFVDLGKEYHFLKNKFELDNSAIRKPDFFKLRPSNFPTIRLSQLAHLLSFQNNIFSKIIEVRTLKELYTLFNITTSTYWDNHFTFGKVSGNHKKRISKSFIDNIVINTVIPLKFCYYKYLGNEAGDEIMEILKGIKKENNSIVINYERFGATLVDAKDSQACLTLYNMYCKQNKCLQCVVGKQLLTGKA